MQKENYEELLFESSHYRKIINRSLIAYTLFGLLCIASDSNLDAFNFEEAGEFLVQHPIESNAVHITGFSLSLIANIPMVATILYYWAKGSESHAHSQSRCVHISTEIAEFFTIGGPFGLMGSTAFLDVFQKAQMSILYKLFLYGGAGLSGGISAFGAYKLHGFHVEEAMHEHGGGLRGFVKGMYQTFIENIYQKRQEQGILVAINDAWRKYGILAVHGLLGYYAADTFLATTGLAGIPVFNAILKILMSFIVPLYEGNTEARSLDNLYRARYEVIFEPRVPTYAWYSLVFLLASGVLHSIPPMNATADLIGGFTQGPFEGILYNAFIYLGAAIVVGYPSIYGFVATTITGFDDAAKGIVKKLTTTKKEEVIDQDAAFIKAIKEDEEENKSSGLNVLGFFKQKPSDERELLDNNNENDAIESELKEKSWQCIIV